MTDMPYLDEDSVKACADLVARTGAIHFEIGYLHDGVPVEKAGWYAVAKYRGARISVDEQRGPVEAADALSRRLLAGAQCQGCRKKVTLSGWSTGAMCRWHRIRDRWEMGCRS